MKSHKILITGGAGYIGSLLTHQFLHLSKNQYNITVIDSLEYGQICKHDDIRFIKQDLADNHPSAIFLQQFDTIVHLAAIVGAPACAKNPTKATKINLDFTKYLVDNISKDQLLIFPNTNSGYGQSDKICTEKTQLNAISLYGRNKNESEKYILDNHEKCVIFRIATVFGVNHHGRTRLDLLVNTMVYESFFGGKLSVFDPDLRRNYIHVRDVCSAMEYCIGKTNMHGQVFNLGNDDLNMTKGKLANKIAKIMHCSANIVAGKDSDKRDYLVSNDKLHKAGFIPDISLETGIKEIHDFCFGLPRDKSKREGILQGCRNV